MTIRLHHLACSAVALICLGGTVSAQPTRVYIAQDDHTDLWWSGTEDEYIQAIPNTLDRQLDLIDDTITNDHAFQNRWNCDGSWWAWLYEQNRTPAQFQRLMDRVASGHISIPLNALCITPGGAPTEAVLRGMYYPGQLERRFGIDLELAYLIENQTQPMGIHSLWAGSGARYSWKGVCGCATVVPGITDRDDEIYNAVGPDGSGVAMKWNSHYGSNEGMGGYAEARDPWAIVSFVTDQAAANGFAARYPYSVIGAFGSGGDDFQAPTTDQFVQAASALSDANRSVIVSNETDFFVDFDATHGLSSLPVRAQSHGNEWDLHCASLAEVTARMKRAVEKLRTAEALATLVSLHDPSFMDGREQDRDRAWMNLGLYWEHDFGMDGFSATDAQVIGRINWQRRLVSEVEAYVDALCVDASASAGQLINNPGNHPRFAAFNPLGWERGGHVDVPWVGSAPISVFDVETNTEVPHEFVTIGGAGKLRVLADAVPPVGYRVFEVRPGRGQQFQPSASVTPMPDGSILLEGSPGMLRIEPRGAISSFMPGALPGVELGATHAGRTINDLGASDGSLQVEHVGPVSATIRADANSPVAHTTRITVYAGSDRVEIHNQITENFEQTLTWSFPFAISNPRVRHEELGAILDARLRSAGGDYADRTARYDWLTLNHFAMMEGAAGHGVYLSNSDCSFFRLGDSTSGSLDTSTPSISVLAGGKVSHDFSGLPDQGGDSLFTQRFALKASGSPDQSDAMRFALEHQNPLIALPAAGPGPLPESTYSLISVSEPGVLLWALKPHDDGIDHGIVARLWNSTDDPATATIRMERGILHADSISHIETAQGAVPDASGCLTASFARQQLRSFRIEPGYVGDMNGDGVLNFADIAAFIDAFLAGDPAADLGDDGIVNFADISALINAFSGDC